MGLGVARAAAEGGRNVGGSGGMPPRKSLKFRPSEMVSGVF